MIPTPERDRTRGFHRREAKRKGSFSRLFSQNELLGFRVDQAVVKLSPLANHEANLSLAGIHRRLRAAGEQDRW